MLMKRLLLALCIVLSISNLYAQCPAGKVEIKVVLLTDNYPTEIQWKLRDGNNAVLLQSPSNLVDNTLYQDSICVDTGDCYKFKITDTYGDGICCGQGLGHVYLYYNDVLVHADSNYTTQSSANTGCPPGTSCDDATIVSTGTFVAPVPNTWYEFSPATTGMYTVSTCSLGNTCDTKLWMYDYCVNLQPDTTNVATIYYASNNCGGLQAQINAYLTANETYYIRVGQQNSSCAGIPINWSLNYNGVVSGCTDTSACNFNPFATVSMPSSCLYYPSPLCPMGADLELDSTQLAQSIVMDTLLVDYQNNAQTCLVGEGCLNGYGMRELVRFDTKISNIGATDFYAGTPPNDTAAYNPIYEWDACHGHWHFEDYAEYLLADSQNNFIPVGYKNGFCVLDLTCTTGSGKFGCNNMGITAGCADIYGAYLDCQWMDITDIPDGNYKLIVRANWIPRPDYYGRYETDYSNNWARTCVTFFHDMNGNRYVVTTPNCAPYIDCNGVENGLAVKDCNGDCNGSRLMGDLNVDSLRDNADLTNYLLASIDNSITPVKCNDLNDDQDIDVVDAALLYECIKHGAGTIPAGHTHEPCRFPSTTKNYQQVADFSIGNIDYVGQTIDIYVKNTNSKILGYQLKLKGVTIQNVQNAITGFTPTMYSKPTGEIIALSSDEIAIPKNLNTTHLLRFSYTSIDSNHVCIDSVIAVVNSAYEEIAHAIVDSACITTTPTPPPPTNVAGNGKRRAYSLYPNPFSKATTLLIDADMDERFDVNVYDMYGRIVRSYTNNNTRALTIEKAELPAGVYFLKISGKDWEAVEKLMIE